MVTLVKKATCVYLNTAWLLLTDYFAICGMKKNAKNKKTG